MYNMNFLITDVIQHASGKIVSFSLGDATEIKSKQFSAFDSWTICYVRTTD